MTKKKPIPRYISATIGTDQAHHGYDLPSGISYERAPRSTSGRI